MAIRTTIILALATCAGSCSLFSSANPEPSRERPVAKIELRGHRARLGVTTTEGVLFLNQDGATGPCRVDYFLGEDILTEDGVVATLGGVYARAEIDLKTQAVPVLLRELTPDDQLIALVFDGTDIQRIPVSLAADERARGDVLKWPGQELPDGTGIFRVGQGRYEGDLQFVGLCNGLATLQVNGQPHRYITFTGPARMREALATPKRILQPQRVKHRPDGISVKR